MKTLVVLCVVFSVLNAVSALLWAANGSYGLAAINAAVCVLGIIAVWMASDVMDD